MVQPPEQGWLITVCLPGRRQEGQMSVLSLLALFFFVIQIPM